ncbi:unnamed protein product [Prorocentrum cordatum]|nr:unnamed protein product [Polarella glacialis]
MKEAQRSASAASAGARPAPLERWPRRFAQASGGPRGSHELAVLRADVLEHQPVHLDNQFGAPPTHRRSTPPAPFVFTAAGRCAWYGEEEEERQPVCLDN